LQASNGKIESRLSSSRCSELRPSNRVNGVSGGEAESESDGKEPSIGDHGVLTLKAFSRCTKEFANRSRWRAYGGVVLTVWSLMTLQEQTIIAAAQGDGGGHSSKGSRRGAAASPTLAVCHIHRGADLFQTSKSWP
jgi:hypothetical protein